MNRISCSDRPDNKLICSSQLDKDDELLIYTESEGSRDTTVFLTKDTAKELVEHINYVLNKCKDKD